MNEHVGLTIKRLREERKLSKSRLSREAGVSDAYIVQIEKGDRSPSDQVLRRLAHVLRVPPHHLLVPAGIYDPETVERIEREADRTIQLDREAGDTIRPDLRDRLIARGYDAFEYEQYLDGLTPEEFERHTAFGRYRTDEVPADIYWGWDEPLGVMPPENWDKLTDADRRLAQKIVNRLARVEDSEA